MDENNFIMKKCLLICPLSFYGWHTSISAELKRRGYDVVLSNDEYPNNILGLVIGNFFNRLARKLTYKKLKKQFDMHNVQYDLILIFKGRGVSSELIELLSSRSNKIVAYNFDSFKYFPHALNWSSRVENYKTFDFFDSSNHSIQRVDLFSDYEPSNQISKNIDFSCVMKNHSERLQYLDDIHSTLGGKYSFKIHIFEKNILTFFKGFIKNPRLFIKWRKHISFKSLNTVDYFNVLESSKFTIDYAHPSQTGITMRCFQALACGTKIITNNAHLNESQVVRGGSFYVHNFSSEPKNLEFFVSENFSKPIKPIKRNVKDFMSDLLAD